MKRLLSLLPILLLVFAACQPETTEAVDPEVAQTAAPEGYDVYGASLTADDAVPVTTVLATPDQYVGQEVTIEGQVSEVCQMRGCWAPLVTDAGTVRIQMPRKADDSDYVFTLPKDISGRTVVASGTLEAKTITAAEQRHYDEDKGAAKDASEYADKVEYSLKPTGVLVQKS